MGKLIAITRKVRPILVKGGIGWILIGTVLWLVIVLVLYLIVSAAGFDAFGPRNDVFDPSAPADIQSDQIRNFAGILTIIAGTLVGSLTLSNALWRTSVQEETQRTNEHDFSSKRSPRL